MWDRFFPKMEASRAWGTPLAQGDRRSRSSGSRAPCPGGAELRELETQSTVLARSAPEESCGFLRAVRSRIIALLTGKAKIPNIGSQTLPFYLPDLAFSPFSSLLGE